MLSKDQSVVPVTGLDGIDVRLLRLLEADARLTYEELGEAVALSGPAAYQRVKKLEREGFIRGYHARLDRERLGEEFLVFVRAVPGPDAQLERLLDQWKTAPAVLECHSLAADGGFLLRLGLKSLRELTAHLDRARALGCRVAADLVVSRVIERS